jgi:hypothetical protein
MPQVAWHTRRAPHRVVENADKRLPPDLAVLKACDLSFVLNVLLNSN